MPILVVFMFLLGTELNKYLPTLVLHFHTPDKLTAMIPRRTQYVKRRLPRDSHQGATLTQTQNKTRQNYYANIHRCVFGTDCGSAVFAYQ